MYRVSGTDLKFPVMPLSAGVTDRQTDRRNIGVLGILVLKMKYKFWFKSRTEFQMSF